MTSPVRGAKLDPPPDYEATTPDGVKAEAYIVRWTVENEPMVELYQKHHQALGRAGELFDKNGPQLEIEIHLNRLDPPPSILYNSHWLHECNRRGQQPVRGEHRPARRSADRACGRG